MKRGTGVAASIIAAGVLLLAAACGQKATEPYEDGPRTGIVNGQPADLIRMPDGFSNGATKCDHGNRVYVLYHGNSPYGAIDVVPQDPSCKGATP